MNQPMTDQFGGPVPIDLVLLPMDLNEHKPSARLTRAENRRVMRAHWYEIDRVILASAAELDGLSEDDPADAGINMDGRTSCAYIANALKRWNPEDGFYHA